MSSLDIYQNHLDKVSRSFAFCIAALEGPLRRWVSLTYLICRILDTVEDAPWKKPSLQMRHFSDFDQMLNSPSNLALLPDWQGSFPRDINKGELDLLNDSEIIFSDLHSFPEKVRDVIQELVGSMSGGMQYFAGKKEGGRLRLGCMAEVNQYCFFVAGVVGETLTKLLACQDANMKLNRVNIVNGHHFGLFLQKVNLLKDRNGDEIEGRFFIPSWEEVYKSVGRNAEGSYNYFSSIPLEQKSYRLFCAWSLYIGLASLPWIQKANQTKKSFKIPRIQTMALVAKIKKHINSPDELKALYDELYSAADLDSSPAIVSSEAGGELPWFSKLYKGELTAREMADLGLIA